MFTIPVASPAASWGFHRIRGNLRSIVVRRLGDLRVVLLHSVVGIHDQVIIVSGCNGHWFCSGRRWLRRGGPKAPALAFPRAITSHKASLVGRPCSDGSQSRSRGAMLVARLPRLHASPNPGKCLPPGVGGHLGAVAAEAVSPPRREGSTIQAKQDGYRPLRLREFVSSCGDGEGREGLFGAAAALVDPLGGNVLFYGERPAHCAPPVAGCEDPFVAT